VDHRKPLPALRPVYARLQDSAQQLEEAPDLYVQETLSRDLAEVLRDFPNLPETVKTAVNAAAERAADKDIEGSRRMVRRAMVACRTWEGEDPDIVLPYPRA
jgi:hypothetical protein